MEDCMAEEKTNETSSQESTTNPEVDSAQALSERNSRIKDLEKQNAQLQEAKSKYYDAVLNGGDAPSAEEKHRSIKDIREDMIKGVENGINNLDYCKLALELDKEVRRTTNESVFVPKGRQVIVEPKEYASADKLTQCLEDCIRDADGDPVRFNRALQSHISNK